MFHLLAFDSRGADLQRRIQRNYDGKYHLVVESGANIERLTSVITQASELSSLAVLTVLVILL